MSAVAGIALYHSYTQTPYTMAWDMAAHTYYGAELAQDIRLLHPLAFLDHVNDSSIALWPFLHSLLLAVIFAIFGFTEHAAVLLTITSSVLTVVAGFLLCWIASHRRSSLPGLLAAFFLLTSPLYLGFSTCVMLETFGAFLTFVTLIMLARSIDNANKNRGILPAVAMLLLFLTKINYGLYLLIPYLIFEMGMLTREQKRDYYHLFGRFLDLKNPKSVLNYLILLDIIAIAVMRLTDGIHLSIFGKAIELKGTRNLIYLAIFLVFLKGLFFYFRNKKELKENVLPRDLSMIRIVALPLFIWFLINPGRPAELIRMSSDRLTDFPLFAFSNLTYYPRILVTEYFCHISIGIAALALLIVAVMRWKKQPPVIRLMLIHFLFGYLGLTFKMRNFAAPRFFFIQAAVVLLIAAHEIWAIGDLLKCFKRIYRIVYYSAVGIAVIFLAAFPVRILYMERLPEIILGSTSTGNPVLGKMVDRIIPRITTDEHNIAIIGECNELSPFLMRWKLVQNYPSTMFNIVKPPAEAFGDDPDGAIFHRWLEERHADVIIAVEISDVSPFAQPEYYKVHQAAKQKLVRHLKKHQDIYEEVSEEGWGGGAIGIKLYKPSSAEHAE